VLGPNALKPHGGGRSRAHEDPAGGCGSARTGGYRGDEPAAPIGRRVHPKPAHGHRRVDRALPEG
jgi:hypothetical protein